MNAKDAKKPNKKKWEKETRRKCSNRDDSRIRVSRWMDEIG